MLHGTARVRGVDLHYLRAGSGDPVFLLAGWPQTSHAWRDVMPALAERYTVIAVDLRGQGASGRSDDGYDAAAIAADLRDLAAELGFERVRVAGHGLGAYAAFAFAAIHRECVESLALLDAPLPDFVPDDLVGTVPPSIAWPRSMLGEPDLAALLTSGRERRLLDTLFAGTDADEYVRWHANAAALRAGLAYHRTVADGTLDRVAPLGIPVLAIGGERSMGERLGEAFRMRARDVESVTIPGAGHFVHVEQPARVAEALAEFYGAGAKIKFGVHTFVFTRRFGIADLPLLTEIKKHGFDGVEIARYDFDDFPAARIATAVRDAGLEATLVVGLNAPLSTVDPDPTIRAKAVAFLKESVRIGAELGATIVSGPVYAPGYAFTGKRRTNEEWQRGVESFRAVTATLTAHGMRMAIEPLNRYQTYFLTTQADTKRFCDEVGHPDLGVLFDMFHANIEEKSLDGSLRGLGSRLFHVHASENDRGVPGSGHNAWLPVAQTLRSMRFGGWVVIESFTWEDPAFAAATRMWRELAPRPCDIAWNGLPFLTSTFGAQ